MEESTILIDDRAIARGQVESVLETTLREGARRLLQEALALEVEEYSQRFQELRGRQRPAPGGAQRLSPGARAGDRARQGPGAPAAGP